MSKVNQQELNGYEINKITHSNILLEEESSQLQEIS